ncbi:MAG: hypothetical protein WAV22_01825 [Porticoccaceae bacterium]
MLDGLLDDLIAPRAGEIRPFSPRVRPAESQQFRGFSPNSPDSPAIKGDSPAPACPAPVPDHRTLIQIDAVVAAAAHAFHNHLFGPGQATGCCAARHARYCSEGARLREAYRTAHRAAEGRQ